jgi:hypothetical protein
MKRELSFSPADVSDGTFHAGCSHQTISRGDWQLMKLAATDWKNEETALHALAVQYLSVHGFADTLAALGAPSGDVAEVQRRKAAQLDCLQNDFFEVERRHGDAFSPLLRLKLLETGIAVRLAAGAEREDLFCDVIASHAANLAVSCGDAGIAILGGALSCVFQQLEPGVVLSVPSPSAVLALAREVNEALQRRADESGDSDDLQQACPSSLDLLMQWREWLLREMSRQGMDVLTI